MNENKSGRILYGGSFNPIHIGHLRVAIEISEIFSDRTEKLAFIPGYAPPHKEQKKLLPYELRINMIEASIADFKNFYCDNIESQLPQPSFTINTIANLRSKDGGKDFYFILGSQDFKILNSWGKGLDLPFLTHLIIVPRGQFCEDDFYAQCELFWPGGKTGRSGPKMPASDQCCPSYGMPGGYELYLASVPYLDISGSEIRNLWLGGGNPAFLLADGALRILLKHADVARACWQENSDRC